MKKRRARFHFRPLHLVAAVAVLLGISLYSAFARGTGPLSFLASRADINVVGTTCGNYGKDDCQEMSSKCDWTGTKCVAKPTCSSLSATECRNNSNCRYRDNECVSAAAAQNDEYYTGSDNQPPIKNETDPEVARQMFRCGEQGGTWDRKHSKCISATNAGIDTLNGCTGLSQEICRQNAGCRWNKEDNICDKFIAETIQMEVEDNSTEFCVYNGSSYPLGTWAYTGGISGGADKNKYDCAKCVKTSKGAYEFGGGKKENIQDCSDQIGKEPVTTASFDQQCGTDGKKECKTCYANINGRVVSVGVGGQVKIDGQVKYCSPSGELADKDDHSVSMASTFCPKGQTWKEDSGCIGNTQEVSKSICDGKCTGNNQSCLELRDGRDYKCVGTASTGRVVKSATECITGVANMMESGSNGNEKFELVCGGAQPGAVVSSASQCASGFAVVRGGPQGSSVYQCKACTPGPNPNAQTTSYITCDSKGQVIYHHCSQGIRQVFSERNTSWECIPNPSTTNKENNLQQQNTEYSNQDVQLENTMTQVEYQSQENIEDVDTLIINNEPENNLDLSLTESQNLNNLSSQFDLGDSTTSWFSRLINNFINRIKNLSNNQ